VLFNRHPLTGRPHLSEPPRCARGWHASATGPSFETQAC
jgi:hypothetical protein